MTLDEVARNRAEFEYPMVLKPRCGGGSRFIFIVKNWEDIVRYQPVVPQPILQAYAGPEEEEYTAGTYRTLTNAVYVILMRRKLKFGMTNSAETVLDRPDLEEFCRGVIQRTDLEGVNNIQFRVSAQGPQIIEINPRFSGTTGIRAHCGFNEVALWVQEALTKQPPDMPVIRPCRVLRYMAEYYYP
jgi:carbamoyl-phosphate synthase large subunit